MCKVDSRKSKWVAKPAIWTVEDSRNLKKLFIKYSQGVMIKYPSFWKELKQKYPSTWKRSAYIFQYVRSIRDMVKASEEQLWCTNCSSVLCNKKHYQICPGCLSAFPDLQSVKRKRRGLHIKAGVQERYGVDNVSQLKHIQKKKEQTLWKNYGVSNPRKVKHYENKFKRTCKERYGVDHPSQTLEFQNKKRRTSRKIYGVDHPSQHNSVKKKNCRTFYKRTGYLHNSHDPKSNQKRELTNLKRYGSSCVFSSKEIRRKIVRSWLEKYGVDNPTKNSEVVEKALRNSFVASKVSIDDRTFQVQGKSEEALLRKLVARYSSKDVLTQFSKAFSKYRDKYKLTYQADFYIRSQESFVECKTWWTLARNPQMLDKMKRKAKENPRVRWIIHSRKQFVVLPKDWYKLNVRQLARLCNIPVLEYLKYILNKYEVNYKVIPKKQILKINNKRIDYSRDWFSVSIPSLLRRIES